MPLGAASSGKPYLFRVREVLANTALAPDATRFAPPLADQASANFAGDKTLVFAFWTTYKNGDDAPVFVERGPEHAPGSNPYFEFDFGAHWPFDVLTEYYVNADDEGGPVVYVAARDEHNDSLPGNPDPIASTTPSGAWAKTTPADPHGWYEVANFSAPVTVRALSAVSAASQPHQRYFRQWTGLNVTALGSDTSPFLHGEGDAIAIPQGVFALAFATYGAVAKGTPAHPGGSSQPSTVNPDVTVLFGLGDAGGVVVSHPAHGSGPITVTPIQPFPIEDVKAIERALQQHAGELRSLAQNVTAQGREALETRMRAIVNDAKPGRS